MRHIQEQIGAVAGSIARLLDYQPYWAARAELLARSGAVEAALQAHRQAIGMEHDSAVPAACQCCLSAGRLGRAVSPKGVSRMRSHGYWHGHARVNDPPFYRLRMWANAFLCFSSLLAPLCLPHEVHIGFNGCSGCKRVR